jgi:hypothetical protein
MGGFLQSLISHALRSLKRCIVMLVLLKFRDRYRRFGKVYDEICMLRAPSEALKLLKLDECVHISCIGGILAFHQDKGNKILEEMEIKPLYKNKVIKYNSQYFFPVPLDLVGKYDFTEGQQFRYFTLNENDQVLFIYNPFGSNNKYFSKGGDTGNFSKAKSRAISAMCIQAALNLSVEKLEAKLSI